jgi:hypothetical protein
MGVLLTLTLFAVGCGVAAPDPRDNAEDPLSGYEAAEPLSTSRGRPHIYDGTVVSDTGGRLRGGSAMLVKHGWWPCNVGNGAQCGWEVPGYFDTARNTIGYNVLRFDVKLSDACFPGQHGCVRPTLAEQLPSIDDAVRAAVANHMYLMIMNGVAPGHYDKGELLSFWSTVAGRYANNTNVLYELTNEPVFCHDGSGCDYTDRVIRDLGDVYNAIRSRAPDTMIMIYDFASLNGSNAVNQVQRMAQLGYAVDWTKTAVAYHFYHTTDAHVVSLKASFPVFMTETSDGAPDPWCPSDYAHECPMGDVDAIEESDDRFVSWVYLDGWWDWNRTLSYVCPNLRSGGSSGGGHFPWPVD